MADGPAGRLFFLPPGADFPASFVRGLKARLDGQPPEATARVEVYLNSARMLRAVREVFAEEGAGFLPQLRLVADLGTDATDLGLPPAVPPLRRRLQLGQLISRLIDGQPDLAPRAAVFDLADSLATLMEEMQSEGVGPQSLASIDVSAHSAHWKRTQDFLAIILPFFGGGDDIDPPARQRLAVLRQIARWQAEPPGHPVIVAGTTGSRGSTALLMQAVARLPGGMLVLPGFDSLMPQKVWSSLSDAMTAEDHPQYRFRRLFEALAIAPSAVLPWVADPRPKPALNRLVSLALRPAPVTDQWLEDGKSLPDLVGATQAVTLVEAADPRSEAAAIALILRHAAEEGRDAALITPDRGLMRQVAAALDRWGILPDDSAGRPLALSAPGRFLRHVAGLFGQRLTGERLLELLKHPLTASGGDRGNHLRWSRDLELKLRREGPAFPGPSSILGWAGRQPEADVLVWAEWLAPILSALEPGAICPLADHVIRHVDLAEQLASGPGGAAGGALWQREAGEAARSAMTELLTEAPHGGILGATDYAHLLDAVLSRSEVRETVLAHPAIRVLGTREARECRADLVILGGLNDGIWPGMPAPDPWLNRQMRQSAGLLLPERQIGLSAHDFQQAIAAPEVVLTRSIRDAEAATVASRWINRLLNLMEGLPDQRGPEAIAAMRARGQVWLDLAAAVDRPAATVPAAPRPSPRPPVALRPTQLAVTGIRTLIRDPYAIYARHVLRLRPLDPLRPSPDALARGSALHRILERFVQERTEETERAARLRLLTIADEVLAEDAPWPTARVLWRARLDRAAGAFLAREARNEGQPVILEQKGKVTLPALGFTLTAKPDRIDILPDGRLHILDYKTGAPPTPKQQETFEKQLLLEAAMAERGAFGDLGPRDVARISYVGLNAAAKVAETAITPAITAQVWADLNRLIARYMQPEQGYTARRAVFETRTAGDYDHLARFGEWEMTDAPLPGDVG